MARIELNKGRSKAAASKSWSDRLSEALSRDISFGSSSIGDAFKERFYSDLHVLVSSGIDIRSALLLLSQESKKEQEVEVIKDVHEGVSAGNPLSIVVKALRGFSEFEVQSISIGEETGKIDHVLENLALDFQSRLRIRRELTSALSYPVLVMTIAVLAVAFMMAFVVPLFSDLFKRMGQDLPWLTQQVIAFSDFILSTWWVILVGTVTLVAIWSHVRTRPGIRSKLDHLLLRIPLLGSVLKESVMARFTGSVAFMLSSEVELLRSLQLSADMTEFAPLREDISRIETGLMKGKHLNTLVVESGFFDARFSAMVRVGEEVNQLPIVFKHLSEQYAQGIQQRTKTLSTFLEPVMIGFVGILVGVILVAMYLPLFEMNSSF